MTAKVKGLKEMHAQLNALGVELGGKALAQAGREAFKPVLEVAKAMAPVDSGELRESLRLGTAKLKDGGVAVGVVIGGGARVKQAKVAAAVFGEGQSMGLPAARRWHFTELGTARSPPHPFLRPAMDAGASGVVERTKPALQRSIDRAVKKRGGG